MITKRKKDARVNLKIVDEVRSEFAIACELLGGTMSSVLHQFIVRTIREEKARNPEAFFAAKEETVSAGVQNDRISKQRKVSQLEAANSQPSKAGQPQRKVPDIGKLPPNRLVKAAILSKDALDPEMHEIRGSGKTKRAS